MSDEQTKQVEPVVQPTEADEQAKPETFVDILIRVELANGPDGSVYEGLQGWMQAKQWLTTLTTSDGQVLPLPYSTFRGAAADPLEVVANEIHAGIVNEVWPDGGLVLITELSGWFLTGEL